MNLGGTVHVNKTGCCILLGVVVIFFLYVFSNRSPSPDVLPNQINLRRLLAAAIKAAESGGKVVVAVSKSGFVVESKGKTKEGANDSVTTADFNSHCVMMYRLKRSFPILRIISEEADTVCDRAKLAGADEEEYLDRDLSDEWVNEKDVKVWIDPLDATQEYTEKLYSYVTTMVCVAVRGEPVIGVIHKPFFEKTTWAWVGRGRSADLMKPQEAHENQLKFIVSRSHVGPAKEVINKMFKDRKNQIISAGGAGYKALEIANGNADVYIHMTAIKKWDICAGNAILNSLGGRMMTKFNTAINYADSENPVNDEGIVATLKNITFNFDKL